MSPGATVMGAAPLMTMALYTVGGLAAGEWGRALGSGHVASGDQRRAPAR